MTTSQFLDAVCESLSRDAGTLNLDDTPESVPEWDSVGHLAIISTIDSELGVSPDEPDLRNFKSIRQLVAALKRMGALED